LARDGFLAKNGFLAEIALWPKNTFDRFEIAFWPEMLVYNLQ
jgi:hypothetical protein